MKRHIRDNFFVVNEGILTTDDSGKPVTLRPSTVAELRKFRFSRLGPKGAPTDTSLQESLATAMTADGDQPDSASPGIPAGFTYLGQFVDHDLTMDRTAVALGDDVSVNELLQGRSPALDLDSLYGRGPSHPEDARFYVNGTAKLRMGTTAAVPIDAGTNVDIEGFDLPRSGLGSTKAARREPVIPDLRNDENLAVAQTHLAFIRFHNRVVDELTVRGVSGALLFERARAEVVRHYQWILRTDLLPRIVDPRIVEDVFTHGRRFFEVPHPGGHDNGHGNGRGNGRGDDDDQGNNHAQPGDTPTMPIEFSVAAYRLGHSMVRDRYQWNRVFSTGGTFSPATLFQLFTFTGVNGILTPATTVAELDDPNGGTFERLPTNWIVDFRRLYDFSEVGRADLTNPRGGGNVTKRIDTLLVDPLAQLPLGAFGGRGTNPPAIQRNLAFRNLARADMVRLASGQQMARLLGVRPLNAEQILTGRGGALLNGLPARVRDALVDHTPLWFYILREAEVGGGRLTGVGGRLVAEVFHRAMSASRTSILRTPSWRPTLGPNSNTFRMTDMLLFAADGKADIINPLGDS